MSLSIHKKKSPEQETTSDMLPETEIRCQHCQFINLPDAELCISCAEPLQREINNPATFKTETLHGTTQEMLLEKTCHYCTYINHPEAKVCAMCSKTLATTAEGVQEQENTVDVDPQNWQDKRECAMCTYLNPSTSNICEICCTSLTGNTTPSETKVPGDAQAPTNDTKTNPVGNVEDSEEYEPLVRQNALKLSKVNITLHIEFSDYFPKEKGRCPKCECECLPDLGPFEERTCASCGYAFCDGCSRPFEQNCTKTKDCYNDPHCHHPRDCVFYLRHFTTKLLKEMLHKYGLYYKEYLDWLKMEAGLRGCKQDVVAKENCGKIKWLCKPYVEYIIGIINKHKVDPAVIMNTQQLTAVIRRELDIDMTGTNDHALMEFMQKNCPLR